MVTLNVNGESRNVDILNDMPLRWTLRDVRDMTGTKCGCGAGLCGACTIHIDGQPMRSCITPASTAAGKRITTIEAIGATPACKMAGNICRCGTYPRVRLATKRAAGLAKVGVPAAITGKGGVK